MNDRKNNQADHNKASVELGPVLQRLTFDPNQSQVCNLLSLMYIVAIDINRK